MIIIKITQEAKDYFSAATLVDIEYAEEILQDVIGMCVIESVPTLLPPDAPQARSESDKNSAACW